MASAGAAARKDDPITRAVKQEISRVYWGERVAAGVMVTVFAASVVAGATLCGLQAGGVHVGGNLAFEIVGAVALSAVFGLMILSVVQYNREKRQIDADKAQAAKVSHERLEAPTSAPPVMDPLKAAPSANGVVVNQGGPEHAAAVVMPKDQAVLLPHSEQLEALPNPSEIANWEKIHFYHNGSKVFEQPGPNRNKEIEAFFRARKGGNEALQFAAQSTYGPMHKHMNPSAEVCVDLQEASQMHFNFVEREGRITSVECFAEARQVSYENHANGELQVKQFPGIIPVRMHMDLVQQTAVIQVSAKTEAPVNPADYLSSQ